jgi:hypothetical protein
LTDDDKAALQIPAVHVNCSRIAAGPSGVRFAFAEGAGPETPMVFRCAVQMSRADAEQMSECLVKLLQATAPSAVPDTTERLKWN